MRGEAQSEFSLSTADGRTERSTSSACNGRRHWKSADHQAAGAPNFGQYIADRVSGGMATLVDELLESHLPDDDDEDRMGDIGMAAFAPKMNNDSHRELLDPGFHN
jgi:hypothetical protein